MAAINQTALDKVARIAKRSSSLQVAALGKLPVLDSVAFARFPEMVKAIETHNQALIQYDTRLKNLLAEALLAAREVA